MSVLSPVESESEPYTARQWLLLGTVHRISLHLRQGLKSPDLGHGLEARRDHFWAVLVFAKWSWLHQSCPWVGLTHGLGWVGSGWVTQNGPMDNSGLHHCSFITPSFNNSEHPFWMFYQWLTMGFLLEFLHYISRDVSTV